MLQNLFGGRINRQTFAVNFTLYLGVFTAYLLFAALNDQEGKFVLLHFFILAIGIIFALSLHIRRLHDTGQSGFWVLVIFLPLGSIALLLYALIKDGDHNTNTYGKVPPSTVRFLPGILQ